MSINTHRIIACAAEFTGCLARQAPQRRQLVLAWFVCMVVSATIPVRTIVTEKMHVAEV